MVMKNDFSVDDIHAIREKQTKMFLTMTNEELKKYFKEQEDEFFGKKVKDNNLVFA